MSIAALPNNMNMEQSTSRVKDSVFNSQNLWKNIKSFCCLRISLAGQRDPLNFRRLCLVSYKWHRWSGKCPVDSQLQYPTCLCLFYETPAPGYHSLVKGMLPSSGGLPKWHRWSGKCLVDSQLQSPTCLVTAGDNKLQECPFKIPSKVAPSPL